MYNCLRQSFRCASGVWSHTQKEAARHRLARHKLAQRVGVACGVSLLSGASWLFASLLLGMAMPAIAQQVSPELRQNFLEDPLTSDPRDPLLPVLTVERDYSPLERQALRRSLDQLNQKASDLFASGQVDAAFIQWRREIKLRRVLGPVEEFDAIARVADLAWAGQRITDVQLLTLRTREIWDAAQTSLGLETPEDQLGGATPGEPDDSPISGAPTADVAFLNALAQTFVTLRDRDSSVEVYEQIAQLSRQSLGGASVSDRIALAELHVDWFEFAEATNIYLELLNAAKTEGDRTNEQVYLERLAYTYQQAGFLLNATRAQTDLLALYQASGDEEKLPELLVAIAQNYRALNLHTSAIDYYRAAYQNAQTLEQFSFSAQVLKELGSLYEALALTEEALGAYSLLIPVEHQAYNDYGIMNAHDKIGQLQRRRGDFLEALKAFERALVIANRLGIQADYFIEQIESVS
ncbi:MAG: tetratricopeptide repeat protein [Cyanobacteria bacterium J06650_10]